MQTDSLRIIKNHIILPVKDPTRFGDGKEGLSELKWLLTLNTGGNAP
jgi:hypothetical protein